MNDFLFSLQWNLYDKGTRINQKYPVFQIDQKGTVYFNWDLYGLVCGLYVHVGGPILQYLR